MAKSFCSIAVVIFAGFIAIRMLYGSERWFLGEQLSRRCVLMLFGFITRLFSSLVGASGGAVSNCRFHAQRAAATSAGVGVPITIAGTLGCMLAGWRHMADLPPFSLGFVSLIGLVLMASVSSYTRAWRAAGALVAEAQARDRLRHVPDIRVAALSDQLALAAIKVGRACAGGRRAPPSFAAG